jgi:AcrR family transcriptional regulator
LGYDDAMPQRTDVTPNRRGARSRELVLDAAERLMAEKGYGAATVSTLVEEAGIPPSSVYHYFDSKEGVLLAVMQRGAERFFEALPDFDTRLGSQTEQLYALVDAVAETLERNPNFLRMLVVMATQPVNADGGEVHRVVERVREMALERLRDQMQIVFGLERDGEDADHLARFALAVFDGAFVAQQSNPKLHLRDLLRHLPAAVIAVRRDLA